MSDSNVEARSETLGKGYERIEAQASARLMDELRARDVLGRLLKRAQAKAERLREIERSGDIPTEPPDHELPIWFANSDPQHFCTNQAQLKRRFPDVDLLIGALRREYLFRTVAMNQPERSCEPADRS